MTKFPGTGITKPTCACVKSVPLCRSHICRQRYNKT
jgi:hypothetical protein